MKSWCLNDMPSQYGKRILVTGANSGLGFATSQALASKKAEVILAVRNSNKGKRAKEKILKQFPEAKLNIMHLDLADLNSVDQFVIEFQKTYSDLDVLINNAGIYQSKRRETRQGFEAHFGVNYLNHYALTLKLMNTLNQSKGGRIVSVGSFIPNLMNSFINWPDLQFKKNYSAMAAYGQSKLALMLFGLKLDRLMKTGDASIKSLIVNPGFTKTAIKNEMSTAMTFMMKLFAQNVHQGALSTLRAATDPQLTGGQFLSPHQLFQMRGYPKVTTLPQQAQDQLSQNRLWEMSEHLTGVKPNKAN